MRKTLKKLGIFALSGLLFGGFAGGAFVGVTYASDIWNQNSNIEAKMDEENKNNNNNNQTSAISTSTGNDTTENMDLDVSDIAKMSMPSIVAITNKSVQEVQSYFSMFGRGNQVIQQEVESSGSGIIIGKNETELLIATNNHVIEDAKTLSVCFVDDQVYTAYTKGTDADNDLAVIAVKLSDIQESTLEQIAIIQIGNSDDLEVGEQVVAIGNALGYGQSVTTGIVSATNRQIGDSGTENGFIQTDAAINPGNSGGALLNMNGELIGINSAKLADTSIEGMGYAIPVSLAAPIINDLMNQVVRDKVSEAEASAIGISGQTVTDTITQMYGIPAGVFIGEVREGSAAEKAGLQAGYVITKFDNKKVESSEELSEILEYYAAGETVEITVKVANHGEYMEKTVTLTLDAASTVRD